MAVSNGSIAGTGSLRFFPDQTIGDLDEAIETLLVAGDPSFQDVDPQTIAWRKRRAPEVRRYGSVCTGVFLLAAAGLLDGKRVTTNWENAQQLADLYPHLSLDTGQNLHTRWSAKHDGSGLCLMPSRRPG